MGVQYCPPESIETAKQSIIDPVGVTIAEVGEPSPETVTDYVAGIATDGDATAISQHSTYPPQYAALIKSIQDHTIDYDNVCYYTFALHPSVTLVPTLPAVGEKVDTSGTILISAFVAEFESEIRITGGVGGALQDDGDHLTTIIGTFGTAMTAAKLLNLPRDQTRHALGTAASLYSGVAENYGTMTKPLHAEMANQNGIRAV